MFRVKTKWGLTAPLSTDSGTDADLKHTEELIQVLREHNLFEEEVATQQREATLGILNSIVQDWAKQVGIKQVTLFWVWLGVSSETCTLVLLLTKTTGLWLPSF